jgi:hypothetical protein
MAEVPRSGDAVRLEPLAAPRIGSQGPAAAFGVGLQGANAEAQEARQVVQGLYADAAEGAIEVATAENLSAMSAKEGELKVKMREARGKSSMAGAEDARAEYDKFYEGIIEKNQNAEVKRRTQINYSRSKAQLDEFARTYVAGQMLEYDNDVTSTLVENESNAAIQEPQNESRTQSAIKNITAELMKSARRNGKPPESAVLAAQKATWFIRRNALNSLVDISSKAAQDYYNEHKQEFDPKETDEINRLLKHATTNEKAARIVVDWFTPQATTMGKDGKPVETAKIVTHDDLNKKLDELLAQTGDVDLRDAVSERARQRMGDIERDEKRRKADSYERGAKMLEQFKLSPGFSMSVPEIPGVMPAQNVERGMEGAEDGWDRFMDMIGRDTWMKYDSDVQRDLKRRFEQVVSGIEPKNDDKRVTKSFTTDPRQLATWTDADLLRLRPYMSDAMYYRAVDRVAAAKEAAASPAKAEKFNGLLADEELELNAIKAAGLGGIKQSDTMKEINKDDAKSQAFTRFKVIGTKVLYDYYKATQGKNADDKIKADLLNNAAMRWKRDVMYYEGWFGFGQNKVALFNLTPEQVKGNTFAIPDENLQGYFNMMSNTPGGLPSGTTYDDFASHFTPHFPLGLKVNPVWEQQVNVAYYLEQLGTVDDDVINGVLLGTISPDKALQEAK